MRSSKGEVKTNLQVQNTATVTDITHGSILQGTTVKCSPKGFSKGYLACSPSNILNRRVIISCHFASEALNQKLHSNTWCTFHTKKGERTPVLCPVAWSVELEQVALRGMSAYLIVLSGLNGLQRAYPVLHFFSVLSTQY